MLVVVDFQLKDAYIEGAKAAWDRFELACNPFVEAARQESWNAGYRSVRWGCLEPVSYFLTPLVDTDRRNSSVAAVLELDPVSCQ